MAMWTLMPMAVAFLSAASAIAFAVFSVRNGFISCADASPPWSSAVTSITIIRLMRESSRPMPSEQASTVAHTVVTRRAEDRYRRRLALDAVSALDTLDFLVDRAGGGVRVCQDVPRTHDVDGVIPSGNCDGRDGIANQVGDRACF